MAFYVTILVADVVVEPQTSSILGPESQLHTLTNALWPVYAMILATVDYQLVYGREALITNITPLLLVPSTRDSGCRHADFLC